VLPAASEQEIKAAYRQAVLRLHPDKSAAHGAPADTAKYQEVQRAWQVATSCSCAAATHDSSVRMLCCAWFVGSNSMHCQHCTAGPVP
jgi:hypothetical protein